MPIGCPLPAHPFDPRFPNERILTPSITIRQLQATTPSHSLKRSAEKSEHSASKTDIPEGTLQNPQQFLVHYMLHTRFYSSFDVALCSSSFFIDFSLMIQRSPVPKHEPHLSREEVVMVEADPFVAESGRAFLSFFLEDRSGLC